MRPRDGWRRAVSVDGRRRTGHQQRLSGGDANEGKDQQQTEEFAQENRHGVEVILKVGEKLSRFR